MFAGLDMFLARLRVVLLFIIPYSVVLTMELFTILCKVALRMAQNIFMTKNVNCINIIITLERKYKKLDDVVPVLSARPIRCQLKFYLPFNLWEQK